MLHFLVLIVGWLLAIGNAANTSTSRLYTLDGRIVGGENADITDFPYQVSVRYLVSHSCGGSILDTGDEKTKGLYVVTAGHCVTPTLPRQHSIKYGVTKYKDVSGGIAFVDRIFRHEQYNANTIDYDIALIRLMTRIPFSDKAQPIRMANATPPAGTAAVVTGWGSGQEGGQLLTALQQVSVEVVDHSECEQQYAPYTYNTVTERMLCAGVPEGGKDACQGDSGGPLVVDGEQVGIVSWGIGCARPNLPGVYSNVHTLRTWLYNKY
ncbi:trypsin alpha-3-like [Anastrepha obliqua]|uniref:trypsin alpha-3-like n=1 Tax=Anastrepha obliqua TaxID=95512 RepID=UPI00240A37AE|nr:trypsin alpha-3-like [Anastrepha obliqua]